MEEEGKGQHLLPISFLRQLIGFYGDNMQRMLLPTYLDASMQAFSTNQERMQGYLKETFGVPFGNMEEMSRQNMAMFDRAMQLFNPFLAAAQAEKSAGLGQQPQNPAPPKPASDDKIADLERKLEEMNRMLSALSDRKG